MKNQNAWASNAVFRPGKSHRKACENFAISHMKNLKPRICFQARNLNYGNVYDCIVIETLKCYAVTK